MEKLRVVLLDDHQVVLAGMKDYLQQLPNIIVAECFSTSSELIRYVTATPPDIIITDYNMPKDESYQDGLKFVGYLVRKFPQIKLLVLTMINNPLIVSALYDLGIAGVVYKQDPLSEMHVALKALRNHKKYYPPSFTDKNSAEKKPSLLQEKINSLSPREFEVLRYFVAGDSIANIAERLNRSAKTISLQKNSAMRKLEIESNQELIQFFTLNNIFD
ncbi:response regulator [Serratia sp. UGAL515B_01]|uniref:response regulator n=1 Tax=Serratia sp. UGAL515B_01 TaxID=2986763 RepID=UPI002953FDAE|nr:response regulator [Serratia sp. UGAL515B_01]WON77495.1 response regulator [Serratia sp. UGAL515B_01]